jgi:multiple sugar transport system substrate-binding protein
VQFWTRVALSSWTTKIVADFNKTHKDLKVKVTSINDAQLPTKLATALRTNDVPDLVAIDPAQTITYMSSNNFLDITKQLDASGLKSVLSAPQLNQSELNGKYYGTSAVLDSSVLVYNKDLFKQAGISHPPTRLNEMLSDARAVRALGPNTYGISFAGQCSGCLAFGVLPNFFADAPLFSGSNLHNQKANVEGSSGLEATLNFYRQAWSEGLAPKSDQSDSGPLWTTAFQAGTVGMLPAGLFAYSTAPAAEKAHLAVAPLPTSNGGISTYIGGANFGIPTKAKNAGGAWEFIKYALSKSAQQLLPASGFAPVRSDLVSDATFRSEHPEVLPELQAAKTGFTIKSLYQAALFGDAAGPWLSMFNKAVFDGDVSGAMKQGQAGFANILSGNGG